MCNASRRLLHLPEVAYLTNRLPHISDQLEGEGVRRSLAFKRARRHSGIVRVLKFVLPLSALLVVAVLGFVAFGVRNAPDVNVGDIALEGDKIVMANPRLTGLTSNNESYTVEAQRALQNVKDINDIDLEGITAQLPFGAGATAKVIAPVGHLDNAKQILTLQGGFNLTTSNGLVAKLQDAVLNFETHSLKTEMPVDIRQPGTHIQAGSLSVTDGGSILVFEKRVRMTIQPSLLNQTREPQNGG
jgi:lipopolysaccharide export system protein LptC